MEYLHEALSRINLRRSLLYILSFLSLQAFTYYLFIEYNLPLIGELTLLRYESNRKKSLISSRYPPFPRFPIYDRDWAAYYLTYCTIHYCVSVKHLDPASTLPLNKRCLTRSFEPRPEVEFQLRTV